LNPTFILNFHIPTATAIYEQIPSGPLQKGNQANFFG
jgi:hypothetical protein